MKKLGLSVLIGAVAGAAVVFAVETASPVAKVLKADRSMERAAHELVNNLPQMHLSRGPFDEAVATNAVSVFLNMLDFEHCYFMASDIERFRAVGPKLAAQVEDGDLEFAFLVYTTLLARIENRIAFVKTTLKEGFDLSEDESYLWKRKDAPWPKDEKEWDDLWRRRVKNQYVAKKVSDALGTNVAATISAEKHDEPETHSDKADAKLTADEGIIKGYERFYTVLKDNDAQWVVERFLNSFSMCFDPHTTFMFPEATEDFEISMNLALVGIGALLSPEDGTAKIERLIPGGPAERDGTLKPGDKVVAVGQGDEPLVDIVHLPLNKAVKMIRGKKGTKVVLKYIPVSDPSGTTTKQLSLIRDEVKLEESAAKGEVREVTTKSGSKYTMGVITLPEFYADMRSTKSETEPRFCSRDVARIIEDFKKQDVEGVILDLRSNGGGSLTEAVKITGLFIPQGPVVLVKDAQQVMPLNDDNANIAYDGPLIVMVNRFSASASEIVAAALQDYGRAVVVGDSKTHGKGTVQTLTPLSPLRKSLGTVKVTTASFHRINGGTTQIKGVTPDIVIPSTVDPLETGEEQLPHALTLGNIPAANYERDAGIVEVVANLRAASETRRSTDPKFAALSDLIQRVKKQQATKEITLKFDDRLKLAKDEKELQKLLDENDASKDRDVAAAPAPTASTNSTTVVTDKNGKKDSARQKANDIILSETLNILADWINATESKAAKTAKKTAENS